MWLQLGLLARLKVDVALIALMRCTSGRLVALSVDGRERRTTSEEVRRGLSVPFLLSRWIDDAASVWEVLENLGGRALAQPEAAESGWSCVQHWRRCGCSRSRSCMNCLTRLRRLRLGRPLQWRLLQWRQLVRRFLTNSAGSHDV